MWKAKNAVDRADRLCYNKTIERQERQRVERQENGGLKMVAFVMLGTFLFVPSFLVISLVFIVIAGLYESTIGLAYEYGYNKNREDKKQWDISYYEDYAKLSGLTLFPYFMSFLCISSLIWGHPVVTLPMLVTAFAVWLIINYTVFYKLGCKNGQKER